MFKALIVAMVTAHAADAATTCAALSRGFVELNPVFGRATCARVIAEKSVVIGAGAAVATALRPHHPRIALAVATVGVTSGSIAFTLNLATLKGH